MIWFVRVLMVVLAVPPCIGAVDAILYVFDLPTILQWHYGKAVIVTFMGLLVFLYVMYVELARKLMFK